LTVYRPPNDFGESAQCEDVQAAISGIDIGVIVVYIIVVVIIGI